MSLSHTPHRVRAYTLIEILVVIVIIGLLTTMATASYNKAQMNARDNSRKTNVISLAHAVEQYYAVNKKLPGKQLSSENVAGSSGTIDGGARDDYMNCEAVDASSNYFYRYSVTTETKTAELGTTAAKDWSCNRKTAYNISGGTINTITKYSFNPDEWSPFPTWIPGLATYINPFPIESTPNDNGTDPLTGSGQTYGYRHLNNGYAVYTPLETTATSASDTNQYLGSSSVDQTRLAKCPKPMSGPALTMGNTGKAYYVICQ